MESDKFYTFNDVIVMNYDENRDDRLIYNLSDELLDAIPQIFYEYLLCIPVYESEVVYEFRKINGVIYLFKDVTSNRDKYTFVYKIVDLQLYKSNMIDYGNKESYDRINYKLISDSSNINESIVKDLPLVIKTKIEPVNNITFPNDFKLFTDLARVVELELCEGETCSAFKRATYINDVSVIKEEIINNKNTHKSIYSTMGTYENMNYIIEHTISKTDSGFVARKYNTLVEVIKNGESGRTYLNNTDTKIGYDKYYDELVEQCMMPGYSSYKGEFQTKYNLIPEPHMIERRKYVDSFIDEIIIYHKNGAVKRYGNRYLELNFDRFGRLIPDMSNNHGLEYMYDDAGRLIPDYGFRRN